MGRSPSPYKERTRDRGDRNRDDRRADHSSSRSSYKRRERSRSRSRYEDRDRSSRYKSSKSQKEKKKERSRSRSPIASTSIGCKVSYEDSPPGTIVPPEIAKELVITEAKFDSTTLSKAAMDWLEEKIVEQVTSRVKEFDNLVRERVAKAKMEMESRLRAQIEQEMKDEMEAMERREKESSARCTAMERALQEKLKEVVESERKLSESRLEMLEVKGKLEMERAMLQKEKESIKKTEQHSILNKGGVMRAPIKLKLGK